MRDLSRSNDVAWLHEVGTINIIYNTSPVWNTCL